MQLIFLKIYENPLHKRQKGTSFLISLHPSLYSMSPASNDTLVGELRNKQNLIIVVNTFNSIENAIEYFHTIEPEEVKISNYTINPLKISTFQPIKQNPILFFLQI
jgi:hypothetical protein